ncbi:MAG TPA: insulinase family protein [Ruminococcaceae bacterium]|nr:insulinase family protein [Oscillospiraceae bacterium]
MKQEIRSERVQESYQKIDHPSGLTLLLYPMEGFSSAYAMLTTDYGSVDMAFRTDPQADFTRIPAGTAHFLEHKMFENEDGDAFAKYAATGASANAFTSFDKTSYLFGCADHFEESLRILLEFVTTPYFTQQTVSKEQGIIGQEIKMYDDNPDWRVLFNLLKAMYVKHPIAIDIAGTVESIAEITADSLYETYRAFYNLRNMVLTVAGSFSPDAVVRIADEMLRPAPQLQLERDFVQEPEQVAQKRIEQKFPVASPMFALGLKVCPADPKTNAANSIVNEIVNEVLAGDASPLYRRLYDSGLINATFDSETDCGKDFSAVIFSGESKDPDRVAREILQEIERIQKEGIDPAAFERGKKAVYGRYIRMLNRPDSIANAMVGAHFSGLGLYDLLEIAANATQEQAQQRLTEDYRTENASLSVISPLD